MPGSKEVDGLSLDRLLAVERAEKAAPARNARQTIDQRLAADFNRERPMASRAFDGESEPGTGPDHDVFVEGVEFRGDAREKCRGHVRSIGIAMELLIRGFADAGARRVGVADQFVESCCTQRCGRIECDLVDGAFDVDQLRLESSEWFAEEAQSLEQPNDVRTDSRGRTEVHDVHGDATADAIEPADALLHDRRLPWQVEQHQATAEFEVATFAARFSGYQQTRTLGLSESRDFGVALRW